MNDENMPPDVDCYTLPNGECIATPCRLHDPTPSDEIHQAIAGRVCGADFTPIDASHPVEWLRGKVAVEFVFNRDDLPGVVIGSTWHLIPPAESGSLKQEEL